MNHKSIWNKLTKKELVHVIEDCLVDDPIKVFSDTRKAQIELQKRSSSSSIPCFDCRRIARKLGIE